MKKRCANNRPITWPCPNGAGGTSLPCLLTDYGHLAGGDVRRSSLGADWYLQWRDVEGRHVVLAAALVLVADYRLPDILLGARALLLLGRLTFAAVYHEDQGEN